MKQLLPLIPVKRYFTIGEVGDLCDVKPHVLRYWEQEFTQLRLIKRRGNRRYYQHHEVLMIRRIRDLLYDQGFTISGARNKMQEVLLTEKDKKTTAKAHSDNVEVIDVENTKSNNVAGLQINSLLKNVCKGFLFVQCELLEIRDILTETI